MKISTTLICTALLGLASGSLYAAPASSNNGQANASAQAGQHAPDARQNVAPAHVNNHGINQAGGNTSAAGEAMSSDEIHKNAQCKDGRCPDINKKVRSGDNAPMDNRKTDGTSQ